MSYLNLLRHKGLKI